MIDQIRAAEDSAVTDGDTMDNLATAANVVEELAGRELSLDEWQMLDELLDQGEAEESAIKKVLAVCAAAAPEELADCDVFMDDNLGGMEFGDPATAHEDLSLEGHALIVGHQAGDAEFLCHDLEALGLVTHAMTDTRNLMRPIPELTGLTHSMDYIFVAESSAQGMEAGFCDALLAMGTEDHCAIFLIDEGLGLLEDWDDWPLAGVLAPPFGPAELRAVLKDVF